MLCNVIRHEVALVGGDDEMYIIDVQREKLYILHVQVRSGYWTGLTGAEINIIGEIING